MEKQYNGCEDTNVCTSSDCVKTAARMLEAMDQTVKPCDDFFEYACGSWNRIHVIPDDKPSFNTFRKLGDELQAILKDLIEERNSDPLLRMLAETGRWPVLERSRWREEDFDLELILSKVNLVGNKPLLQIWVGPDDQNSNVHIIHLDQAKLGMTSREYFLKSRDDSVLKAYRDYAISVAVSLGADPSQAQRELTDVVDFEIQLANITEPEENRRDAQLMYRRYKLSELSTNVTNTIDWSRYLKLIFSNVSIQLNSTQEVVVKATSYLYKLGELLKRTPKRTVANYIIWYMTMYRVGNLAQRFIDLRKQLNKALTGTDIEQPRWRNCVNFVNDNLGMAVGRIFVRERFHDETKTNAMDMVQAIHSAFVELLEEVPWMDAETKKVAREKADAIQEKIGYPDYIMNDTALNLDYEEIRIDPDTYFENLLSIQNTATRNMLKNLRLPVDRSKWTSAPAVVNAFYNVFKNQIVFPAAILQPPFYHSSNPKSLNFGGIAMVVGHELTHGFDDRGRQFNKNGNLKQWWSDSVIEKFKEKALCIIDQYSNYTVKEAGLNLNGRLTQGENIADNGGLKQAFRAYRRWVEQTEKEEQLLPGLPLSHEQLFFLNFAQIWCGTARPESYVQSIRSGRHSPGRFRVIGALSNSVDFAEAYNCPLGSPMNPVNKCSVW